MKTTKTLLIAFLLWMYGISNAQTQDTVKIINDLPDFSSINISGALSVVLTQDFQNTMRIEKSAGDVLPDYKVENQVLIIKGSGFSHSKSKVYISVRNINQIQLHGPTTLKGEQAINSPDLRIETSGASDVELNLITDRIEILASGASDIELKGKSKFAKMEATGASDIKAIGFEVDSALVSVSGAGDAQVNAKNYLSINASGAGDVKYLGNPLKVDKNISGASDVIGDVDTARINIFGKKKLIIIGDDKEYDTDSDTTNREHKEKIKNKHEIYWAGFGLGVNGYMNKDYTTNMTSANKYLELNYAKSMSVSLNFLEKNFSLVQNHINLVTGLGLEYNNYRFDNDYTLWSDSSKIGATLDPAKSFSKNKLVVMYLQAPLLLQFDTRPLNKKGNKTLHMSLGAVGSWRVGSHLKQTLDSRKLDKTSKERDDFNLAAFRYSPMVRVGYGNIDIWASYTMNNMFKANQGPELNQFNVGITLAGF